MTDSPLGAVADYYTDKIGLHGPCARGVDWNGEESQQLRFRQLARVIDGPPGFSINDLGCGYGAFYDHLLTGHGDFRYAGIDVSEAMIETARRVHQGNAGARFLVGSRLPETTDYTVASGIFNICLDADRELWRRHILDVLDQMNEASSRGFAFNCLTSYSDPERQRPDLFYADPCWLFDHCKRRFARNVALLHDYGLYEFTLLVRKAVA